MPQVLRLDDGDARIKYAELGAWETVVNSTSEWNRDGTYHRAKATKAQLFFLFRGTRYSCSCFLYGAIDPRQALGFLSMASPEEAEHQPSYNSTGRI